MPFKSEKQRKLLHATEPEVAEKWEGRYATGGILKAAIANQTKLPDLARMRSGGMVGNGSKAPNGVVDFKVASCNKFRES